MVVDCNESVRQSEQMNFESWVGFVVLRYSMESGKRVRLEAGAVGSLKKQKLAGSALSDNEESLNGVDHDEGLEVSPLLCEGSY